MRSDDMDFRAGGLLVSFSELSDGGCDSFFSPLPLLKSNAEPGVFGVLVALALPKLANAPLPSPKAEEAPDAVGEATEVVEVDAPELNALGLLLKLG